MLTLVSIWFYRRKEERMNNFGNPAVRGWSKRGAREQTETKISASYKGVVWKSTILILLTMVVAITAEVLLGRTLYKVSIGEMSAQQLTRSLTIGYVSAGVAGAVMLVGFLFVMFNADAVKVVAPIYAIFQGVFLGTLAGMLNLYIRGVSLTALVGTALVFVVCLLLYKALGARLTNRFAMGMTIALISFFLIELICVPIIYFYAAVNGNVTLILGVQAGIALFCVIFGSITVFADIQNIDSMVRLGADKKYEWVLAFSLTTSLVYLYIEILGLLIRVVALLKPNKS